MNQKKKNTDLNDENLKLKKQLNIEKTSNDGLLLSLNFIFFLKFFVY